MENLHVLPHCPWYDWYEKFGPPNISWCESPVCSYFNNPANTWSNLGFILVSLYVYQQSRKLKCDQRGWYALLAFVVGATSFFYHATNNFLTQYFDFIGMFAFLSYLGFITFYRIDPNEGARGATIKAASFFIIQNILFYVLTITNLPTQFIVFFSILLLIFLEVKATKTSKPKNQYKTHGNTPVQHKYFYYTLMLFIVGEILSLLDLKRVFCDPDNHLIQGHALWHLFGAAGFYLYSKYLAQFRFFKLKD